MTGYPFRDVIRGWVTRLRLLSHAMWRLSSGSQSGFNSAVVTVSQPQNRVNGEKDRTDISRSGHRADGLPVQTLSTSGIMGCVGMIVRIVQSYNCVHVDAASEELGGAGQSTHRKDNSSVGKWVTRRPVACVRFRVAASGPL
ncbi:hypothetical protein B0H14DRAFT_2584843 [Mycena olivaceomarginata]|nr:hypothetical protein B0H14DRAFT_2584843 [Mycena olivaceomarginata]